MINNELRSLTRKLFSQNVYDDSIPDEEFDKLEELAEEVIEKYGWNNVYSDWISYLYDECTTDDMVVNFATLFLNYDGCEKYNPDPYKFIAYLYYRVDVTKNSDAFDIFDTIAITLLPHAGLVNLYEDPNYSAQLDPKIQAEIAIFKSKE